MERDLFVGMPYYQSWPQLCNPSITRWEAFTGRRPNVQQLRLLPIFSILLVHTGMVYEYGIYCGPQYLGPHVEITPGVIRAVVKTDTGAITVFSTQNCRCVSEGYNIDINPNIDKGLIEIMSESDELTNEVRSSEGILDRSDEEQVIDEEQISSDTQTYEPTNQVNSSTDEPTIVSGKRVSILPTESTVYRSRCLNQLAPEYVPAYIPAHGLLMKGGVPTCLVPNQTGSELRGEVPSQETIGLASRVEASQEEMCFFSDENIITKQESVSTVTKVTKNKKKRDKLKLRKQELIEIEDQYLYTSDSAE
jgi:hypothetical protein